MNDPGLVVAKSRLHVPPHVAAQQQREARAKARELCDYLWPISSSLAAVGYRDRMMNVHAARAVFVDQREKVRPMALLIAEAEKQWAEYERKHGHR